MAAIALVALVLGCDVTRAGEADPASRPLPDDDTPRAQAIRWGKELTTQTYLQLPGSVGNRLSCSNCHLGAGTVAHASPWIGIWGAFPEYRARSGKMISLEERINDCMRRSMNGAALAYDSPAMLAFLAYIQWLSEGVPTGASAPGRGFGAIDQSLQPDETRGRAVYARVCAACHALDGQGQRAPNGTVLIPAVWGAASFNNGAGMARTYTAAAFIRHNMPLGGAGGLTDQEAIDVAQFVTHQPRPDFAARHGDWPRGDAPGDARLEPGTP